MLATGQETGRKLVDRLSLVSTGFEGSNELELCHETTFRPLLYHVKRLGSTARQHDGWLNENVLPRLTGRQSKLISDRIGSIQTMMERLAFERH